MCFEIFEDYKINTWYPGVVLRLSPFGAFMAIRSTSGTWAEGLVKTNQIQGNLELGAEVPAAVGRMS